MMWMGTLGNSISKLTSPGLVFVTLRGVSALFLNLGSILSDRHPDKHSDKNCSVKRGCTVWLTLLFVLVFTLPAYSQDRGVHRVFISAATQSGESIQLYKGSHALLIGVSEYDTWTQLPSIPSELDELATALEAQEFHVERLVDPDSRELKAGIENFISEYGYDTENRLLIFFSGHGHSINDRGYILPVDIPLPDDRKSFRRKALPMSQVLAWARNIDSKHVLFLFDSCFSGSVFKSKNMPTPAERYIRKATNEPVRQFITAGSANETVPAKSTFTPALVNAIKGEGDLNKDGYITGSELGVHMSQLVPKYVNQTPQYGKIRDYGLSRGDFVFITPESKLTKKQSKEAVKVQPQDSQSNNFEYEIELELWRSAREFGREEDYKAYLDVYPDGKFAGIAKNRIRALAAEIKLANASKKERLAEVDAARLRREEEQRVQAEAEQQRLEKERLAKAEAERLRLEEEKRLQAEAEQQRLEKERLAKAEAERLRLEEEKRLQAEVEQQRLEKERLAKVEAERLKYEEEQRLKAEAEQQRLEKERLAKAEAERVRLEEEQRLKAEALIERLRTERLAKWEAERLKEEEEERLQAEAEQKRVEEERLAKLEAARVMLEKEQQPVAQEEKEPQENGSEQDELLALAEQIPKEKELSSKERQILVWEEQEKKLGLNRNKRREIQETLNRLGYSVGITDGIWGRRTRRGLQQFQKAQGFIANGYINQESYEALLIILNKMRVAEKKEVTKQNATQPKIRVQPDSPIAEIPSSEISSILEKFSLLRRAIENKAPRAVSALTKDMSAADKNKLAEIFENQKTIVASLEQININHRQQRVEARLIVKTNSEGSDTADSSTPAENFRILSMRTNGSWSRIIFR